MVGVIVGKSDAFVFAQIFKPSARTAETFKSLFARGKGRACVHTGGNSGNGGWGGNDNWGGGSSSGGDDFLGGNGDNIFIW